MVWPCVSLFRRLEKIKKRRRNHSDQSHLTVDQNRLMIQPDDACFWPWTVAIEADGIAVVELRMPELKEAGAQQLGDI